MSCGEVADVAQILCCCVCGCGVGWNPTAPIRPLAWELPYAEGEALNRKKKKKKDISDKGEGGGACSHAYILLKFAGGFVKVTTSHGHQSSLKDFSVFLDMKRCKNRAHKSS